MSAVACWAITSRAAPSFANVKEPKSAQASVLSVLSSIEHSLVSSKYSHYAKINAKMGIYEWDCSIMAAWVLAKAAPQARRSLGRNQPLARDFYRGIVAQSTRQQKHGWLKVAAPMAIEAGDVFAWIKPPMFKERKNTGHVGFVVAKPWRHPQYPNVWLMRIADATRELHEKDTRSQGGNGGFGQGTIAFEFDDDNKAIAYGWYGEAQDLETYVPTSIVFGRVVR